MKGPSKARFPVILLCSVVFHLGVVGLLYGAYLYDIKLKFGSFSFDSSGEARYKVAMLDRTKPLYLPPGFYAVEKPPKEVKKPEERPKTDDKDKAGKDKKSEKDDETRKGDKPEDQTPLGDMKFGKIQGGALKPHLQQIYRAYEEGRISITSFTVTVTCKAQRDGSLTDVQLVKSSGEPLIDQTAMTLVREISDMHALAPLSLLSSLSLTLEKTPSSATLTAVGFSNNPDVTQDFANQLGSIKFLARLKMENPDQTTLLDNIQIAQSGNRVSVSLGLPNSVAGDMMRRSFGSRDQAKTGT